MDEGQPQDHPHRYGRVLSIREQRDEPALKGKPAALAMRSRNEVHKGPLFRPDDTSRAAVR